MRIVARLLPLLMITLGMTVLTTAPAEAISCRTGWTDLHPYKVCRNWNYWRSGAGAFDTYSVYNYSSPTGHDDIHHNLVVKDTRADGKCAVLRARKMYSAWNWNWNWNRIQTKVCGKGKRRRMALDWRGLNMASGRMVLYLCTGATFRYRLKPGNTCTEIWSQKIR